jgi:hypothetical protein
LAKGWRNEMNRWTLLVMIGCLVSGGVLRASDAPTRDEVKIESVSPGGPVTRGVETEFTIGVYAELESAEEGTTMVGFNAESPTIFKMVDSHLVKRGENRFSFKVRVIPADWGERAKFAVQVNLGGEPGGAHWRPTSTAKQAIEVEP